MNTYKTNAYLGKPPCTETEHTVTQHDLPLSCPLPQNRLWDGHPRVYLPIEKTGKETCPYCGTTYILETYGRASNP